MIAETSRRSRRWRRADVQKTWVPLVRNFETGISHEAEFAQAVVSTYDLSLEPVAFLLAFRAAAVGFYPGALDLLGVLRARYRLVSLSNTNAVQWPVVLSGLAPADPFHAHYPSHRSGFHKPDPRAFAAIITVEEANTEFFFFDDRAENVAAAIEFGWRARRVRGVSEARRACEELGLL